MLLGYLSWFLNGWQQLLCDCVVKQRAVGADDLKAVRRCEIKTFHWHPLQELVERPAAHYRDRVPLRESLREGGRSQV